MSCVHVRKVFRGKLHSPIALPEMWQTLAVTFALGLMQNGGSFRLVETSVTWLEACPGCSGTRCSFSAAWFPAESRLFGRPGRRATTSQTEDFSLKIQNIPRGMSWNWYRNFVDLTKLSPLESMWRNIRYWIHTRFSVWQLSMQRREFRQDDSVSVIMGYRSIP